MNQISQSGILLVQSKLRTAGVKSFPSARPGVDLKAPSESLGREIKIKVTTNLRPKPSGGKGRLHQGWRVTTTCPSDLVAFVDLETSRVWFIKMKELSDIAQQHSARGYHLFMSVDPEQPTRADRRPVHDYRFERYLLENRVDELF